ncbi:unnamed protein product, partial [Owenia fusiformis]
FDMLNHEYMASPWLFDEEDETDVPHKTKIAYESLIHITVSSVMTEAAEHFRQLLPIKMMEEPWNFNDTYLNGLKGSAYSLYLYDAVMMYLRTVNYTLERKEDPANGTLMFENAKAITFSGMTGHVKLDHDAEREPNFWLWHLSPSGKEFTYWAVIEMEKPLGQRVNIAIEPFWKTRDRRPPPDVPACGFYDEFCTKNMNMSGTAVVGVTLSSTLGILLLVGFGAFLIYRKKKLEVELLKNVWQIQLKDITFPQTKKQDGSMHGGSVDTNSEQFAENNSSSKSNKNMDLGNYKGLTVYLKYLSSKGSVLLLTKEDHQVMKIMKDLNHENINQFFGLCVQPGQSFIVSKFCHKKSLKGLTYLHSSKLVSHGSLKSSNCLIDSRWQLKISGYGLSRITKSSGDKESDYGGKIWTAPELLRMTNPPSQGTPKGDCYSFAIILHEIIFREEPFSTIRSYLTPKDIVKRVARSENPPFRPAVSKHAEIGLDNKILDVIYDGWQENPEYRPSSLEIRKTFTKINKGRKVNISDRAMMKMESYANNLEEIVEQKTHELIEEKTNGERLLHSMLPRVIADSLKAGKGVYPQKF